MEDDEIEGGMEGVGEVEAYVTAGVVKVVELVMEAWFGIAVESVRPDWWSQNQPVRSLYDQFSTYLMQLSQSQQLRCLYHSDPEHI